MFYVREVQNLLRASNFRTPARRAGFENFRLWSIGGSGGLLRHVRSTPGKQTSNGRVGKSAGLPTGDSSTSRGMISSRRPAAPQSALLRANAVPQAIDSVTRFSSRVEFVEAEFNGTGARSPYIQYQVSASDAASR